MKKLNLKNLKLSKNDMLQRDQLKTVFGGYDGGGGSTSSCTASSGPGKDDVTCNGTDCIAVVNVQCSAKDDQGVVKTKKCK